MSLRCFLSWRRLLCVATTVLTLMLMASQAAYAATPAPLTNVSTPDTVITRADTGRFLSRINHGIANASLPETITLQASVKSPFFCYNSATNQIIASGQTSADPTCKFTLDQVASGPGLGNFTLKASNGKYLTITGTSHKQIQASEATSDKAESQFFLLELLSNYTFIFQGSTGFYLNGINSKIQPNITSAIEAGSTSIDNPTSQFTLEVMSS